MINLGILTVRSTIVYYVCAFTLTVVPVIKLNEYVSKIVILIGLSALSIGEVRLIVRMDRLKLLGFFGNCGNLGLLGVSIELNLSVINVNVANVFRLGPISNSCEYRDRLIACKYSAFAYALFVNVELKCVRAVTILKVLNGKSEPLACNRNLCDSALVLSKEVYVTLSGAFEPEAVNTGRTATEDELNVVYNVGIEHNVGLKSCRICACGGSKLNVDLGLEAFDAVIPVNLRIYTIGLAVSYFNLCTVSLTVDPKIVLLEDVGKIAIVIGLSARGIGEVGLVSRINGICGNGRTVFAALAAFTGLVGIGYGRINGNCVIIGLDYVKLNVVKVMVTYNRGPRHKSYSDTRIALSIRNKLFNSKVTLQVSCSSYALLIIVECKSTLTIILSCVLKAESEPLACGSKGCNNCAVLIFKLNVAVGIKTKVACISEIPS